VPLALLCYWAVVPTRYTAAWFDVGDLPIDYRDLTLAGLAAVLLCVVRTASHDRIGRLVLCANMAAVAYALTSLGWAGIERADAESMAWTLVLHLSSVLAAYTIVGLLTKQVAYSMMYVSALVLSGIGALYTAQSLLDLGLRSPQAVNVLTDFGMQRVNGPLFDSPTGHFVLIPALAFLVYDIVGRRRLAVNLVASLFLIATILGTGSRAAVLGTLVFMSLLLTCASVGTKLKPWIVVLMVALTLPAIVAVFKVADPARLYRVSDREPRLDIHLSAFELAKERPWMETALGSGYGSIWPWYRVNYFRAYRTFHATVATRYGFLKADNQEYHSHSVALLAVMELGIPGAAFFIALCLLLIRAFQRYRRQYVGLFAAGLLASGSALFMDLFFFSSTRLCFFWWLMLFVMLKLASTAERGVSRRLFSVRGWGDSFHSPLPKR
jgi:hypothetical protein